MAKYLVIVESPAKSKTIEHYLGSDYKVVSSKGHVRELSKHGKLGLGIDLDNNFAPDYVYIPGKKKVVDEIKKIAKGMEKVYLATDPDREGEAISWHLYDTLKLNDKNYDRVVFNEITKGTVTEAFNHPRKIDQDLVYSQEARMMLDKIIGFRLSKLVQIKTNGKSAGRVQSVALKLIVEKEREIQAFIPHEYYTITAHFKDFDAELFSCNHEDIEITSAEEADNILSKLGNSFIVDTVETKTKAKKPNLPFTTSTMQQEASTKLSMGSKKTMSVAQKLYEGITLSNETVGLITYMRTDSTRLSSDFVNATYKFIKDNYGEKYVGFYKETKKGENVQDAHEGIRPTSIDRTPESVRDYLSNDEYKLYKLIYTRALASLMKDAKTNNTTIVFDNNNYQFKTTGQVIIFDGYLKVYKDYEDVTEKELPGYLKDNKAAVLSNDKEKVEHTTQPPARYTEAKLIKEMEKNGIGRPSTYATIIENIKTRGYANLIEKKFVPTDIGFEVTDKLQDGFSNIINVKYTAQMEEDLDLIAEGKLVWYETLDKFYKEFAPMVDAAFTTMPKKEAKKTGELCPECGSELVIRKGRYGEFTACSNYPECKYIKKEPKEEKIIKVVCKCIKCGGDIIERTTRRGKIFYGCSGYPKCTEAFWDMPTGNICPVCGGMMTIKNEVEYCPTCNPVKAEYKKKTTTKKSIKRTKKSK